MEFKAKGWPAVGLIVALLMVVIGYRVWFYSNPEISAELRKELERELIFEISGAMTSDAEAALGALQQGDREEAERLSENLLKRKVELRDFAMRGSGDDVVVRANYVVHGPEGAVEKTGYFKYSHAPLTGWVMRRRSSVWAWHSKLF